MHKKRKQMSNKNSSYLPIIAIIVSVIALGYAYLNTGSLGPVGPQGIKGEPGPQGPAGPQGQAGTSANMTAVNSAIDARVAFEIPSSINATRGCTACHTLRDASTGKYTLSYEAHNAFPGHPNKTPSGVDISATSTAGVEACLECHASSGSGAIAGISLMDIVHPVHMFSQVFKYEFGGNCFSCHNVDSNGVFEVLPDAVSTNSKGVPDTTPIPGAYEP
jgi:hypothetical protein